MKTALKLVALLATTAVFAGCSIDKVPLESDLAAMKTSIEEARAAAVQANQYAQQALQLAQQNASKIDRVFQKSQLK